MKKHNEGYALVLVLVVITVLSLVAMAMMAGSLRNLQNQQKSIERMEAKYTAQGEIEKVIAGFEKKIAETKASGAMAEFGISEQPTLIDFAGVEAKVGFGETQYFGQIDGVITTSQDYLLVNIETIFGEEDHREEDFRQVKCTIKITGDISKKDNSTEVYLVNASTLKWECVSYTITEGGGS